MVTIIAGVMQQSALLSMEQKPIQLRNLDIVYQALGKISQKNTTDPVVQEVLENPTHFAELNNKAHLYEIDGAVVTLMRQQKIKEAEKNIAELRRSISTQ